MSTSLSRQLAQLKASSITYGEDSIIKDGSLDRSALTSLAKESFRTLVEDRIPELDGYWNLLFPDDDSEYKIRNEEARGFKEFWSILCPWGVLKETQWLIEYGIKEKKLNVEYPIELFRSILPLYDYEIFKRVLHVIPVKRNEAYPDWLNSFKSCCLPVSRLGLLRYWSSNDGFFKLMTDGILEDKFSPRALHFYTSNVTAALNSLENLRSFQVHQLLRVILASFKSSDKEFRSCGYVLLSFLLPRAELSSDVCLTIVKLLKKLPSNRDILSLSLILYRSQDLKTETFKLLLNQDYVMEELFLKKCREQIENIESYKSVVTDTYVLCLMNLVKEEEIIIPSTELLKLLEILHAILLTFIPTSEAAKALAARVSLVHVRMKALSSGKIRHLAKPTSKYCKKILSLLRVNFPYEYSKHSLQKVSAEADILFMDETNDSPTEDQIKAKKILLDNKFINTTLSEKCLSYLEYHQISRTCEAKDNVSDLLKVLSQEVEDFLMKQIEPIKLINLTINSLRIFPKNSKVLKCAINIFTKISFEDPHKNIMDDLFIDIRLILLPSLFPLSEKSFPAVKILLHSGLFSAFENIIKDSSLPLEEFRSRIFKRLVDSMDFSNKFENLSCTYQDPSLVVIGLLSLSQSENSLCKQKIQNILNLMKFILSSKMDISYRPLKDAISTVLETIKHRHIGVPAGIFSIIFDKLLKVPKLSEFDFEEIMKELVLFSSKVKKQKHEDLYDMTKSFIKQMCIEQGQFYGDILSVIASLPCSKVSEKGISSNVIVKTLKDLLEIVNQDREVVKRIISFKSVIFPRILACTLDKNRSSKTTKLCFEILRSIHGGKFKSLSNSGNFLPLIGYILERQNEIEADLSNVASLVTNDFIKRNKAEEVLDALARISTKTELFTFGRAAPFFTNTREVSEIAEFSLKKIILCEENSFGLEEAWNAVLHLFFPKMIPKFTDEKSSCYNFFWTLMKSTLRFNFSSNCASAEALAMVAENMCLISDQVHLFNMLIDLGGSKVRNETMIMAKQIIDGLTSINVKTFNEKLISIWGSEFFVVMLECKRNLKNSEEIKDEESRWIKTNFMLECFLRRKDLFSEGKQLIPSYMRLLKRALFAKDRLDGEESYSQDLILSNVLHIIESLSVEELSAVDSIDPELIVHCVRNSSIPTTKSTALMILAKSSACNPDYVLHNSIPIFTFMGSHFVKMDSKHSFDVACQAIGIIVPHIRKACGSDSDKLRSTSIKIITTFADASDDVPSHRFKTFLHQLITLLGDKEYLWIFTLQLLGKALFKKSRKSNEIQVKLMDLFEAFDIKSQIETIMRLTVNIKKNLPELRQIAGLKKEPDNTKSQDEFNLLRLKCLSFISHLLTSRNFGNQVTKMLKSSVREENSPLRELELLLEVAIINLEDVNKSNDQSKIHKFIVTQSEKMLEFALSILPNDVLVSLMRSLLSMDVKRDDSIRRKTLEVLNAKLGASNLDEKDGSLLEPLLLISLEPGLDYNRQMSLLAIRSLSRHLGSEYPENFGGAAAKLSEKSYISGLSGQHNLIASTLLCVVEIFSSIGPQAVPLLSGFMNWILTLLEEEKETVVLNSAILAIQKTVESFGGFLHPFYARLVLETCRLDRDGNRHVRGLMNTLSKGIPTQSLIATCSDCFKKLVNSTSGINGLLEILNENLSNLNKRQALSSSSLIMDFFLYAFKYRLEREESEELLIDEDKIERNIIDTFLTLTLKLPLDDFKPLFYRVINSPEVCHISTVFHIILRVSEKLKSLFSFVADPVISKIIAFLSERFAKNQGNDGIEENPIIEALSTEEETSVNYALEALSVIFSYNKIDIIMTTNYEDNTNAILNYYEIVKPSSTMLKKLNSCVCNLSKSTEDDSQWKYLHYQVLLNLRSSNVQIRLSILELISLFVDARGDSYMSVLPDAVPFLAETSEDEDKDVEKRTKNLLKKMEEVFGQSIDNYFEM